MEIDYKSEYPKLQQKLAKAHTRIAELQADVAALSSDAYEQMVKVNALKEMSAKFFLNGIPFTEENLNEYIFKLDKARGKAMEESNK